jgi:negative regulator of genetic competence, sporulation and motility
VEYNRSRNAPYRRGICRKETLMELIVISEGRLKITLTEADMARYELADPQGGREDGWALAPHARRALRHILADANENIDFDAEGERLFVQLYTSKGGGCEIFVTRMEDGGEARLLRAITDTSFGSPAEEIRAVWMRLESLEDVTALCKRLVQCGFRGESQLYITPEPTAWYLHMSFRESRTGRLPGRLDFRREYGTETGDMGMYLAEHGRPICREGAVERMAALWA